MENLGEMDKMRLNDVADSTLFTLMHKPSE